MDAHSTHALARRLAWHQSQAGDGDVTLTPWEPLSSCQQKELSNHSVYQRALPELETRALGVFFRREVFA